eukprot:683261-Amphidinium_carterae.1
MAYEGMSIVLKLKLAFWWGLRKHPAPMLRLQTGASEDDEQINPTQQRNTRGALPKARIACTMAGSTQAPAILKGLHGCRAKGGKEPR